MYRLFSVITICLASSVALADDAPSPPRSMRIATINGVPLVELQDGACMRGPITVRSVAGDVTFKLAAGVWFPSDCTKNK